MEKRTAEGKRRHDLGKKIWYAEKRLEKITHEQNNGLELGYPGVRISDYLKEKILSGQTQILVVNSEAILFRKKSNGYWFNNSWKGTTVYLHREKMKLYLGFTDEQMEGYEVHHIDENPDNNDLSNLKLATKKEHHDIHDKRNKKSKRHVCKKCGRTYFSSVSNSVNYCNRCGG